MKLCFCRFLLSAGVFVVALVWWPETWAKWVVVVAAGLMAILGLFYNACCMCMRKTAEK